MIERLIRKGFEWIMHCSKCGQPSMVWCESDSKQYYCEPCGRALYQ